MIIDTQNFSDAIDLQLALKVLIERARAHSRANASGARFDPEAVYVAGVKSASLEAAKLTDGSIVYNIILT